MAERGSRKNSRAPVLSHSTPRTSAVPVDNPRLAIGIALLLGSIIAWPYLFGGTQSYLLTIGPWGELPLLAFAIFVVLMAAWPPSRRAIFKLIERIRPVEPRRRFFCSIGVTVFAAIYLSITAAMQDRPRFPYFHDENSYLIQARQFAAGRLWEPAHPLGDFFDSFQLLTTPVYGSPYFPGTAILYVPGVRLHVPPWWTSIAIASIVAGLMFRITAELLDGVAAILSVVLLMAVDPYRQSATLLLGQMPCLMYGLLAVLAYLRWADRPRIRRAFLIGIALGLAAVTRPVDALIFGIPIAVAVIGRGPWPLRGRSVAAVAVGLLPFLSLQLVMNRGITGEFFRTPFRLYADRDYPGSAYGFHHFDFKAEPVSTLEQKRILFDRDYTPVIAEHTLSNAIEQQFKPWKNYSPARFQMTFLLGTSFAFPLLILFIPLSILAMTRRRAVVAFGGPLFLILYVPYVFFFSHYVLTAAAGIIVAILIGGRGAEWLLPRWRNSVAVAVFLTTGGLALAAWPQFDPSVTDVVFDTKLLSQINTSLATIPATEKAVVLFRFDPKRDLLTEPVYNIDVAWPDEARIVRAHDLGTRNGEIFGYYRDRIFYRYDEASGALTRLGNQPF